MIIKGEGVAKECWQRYNLYILYNLKKMYVIYLHSKIFDNYAYFELSGFIFFDQFRYR